MGVVVNIIENPDEIVEFWLTNLGQPLIVPKPKKHKHELYADSVEEGYEIVYEILGWPPLLDLPQILDLRLSIQVDKVQRIPVVVDENEYRGPIISIS